MGLSTCRRTLTPSKTPGADGILHDDLGETGRALNVTEADLDEAREIARTFTFDDTQRVRGIAPVGQVLVQYSPSHRRSVDGTGAQTAFSRSQLPHPNHRQDRTLS